MISTYLHLQKGQAKWQKPPMLGYIFHAMHIFMKLATAGHVEHG